MRFSAACQRTTKDTEALIGDLQMPKINPKIIGGHECLLIAVD